MRRRIFIDAGVDADDACRDRIVSQKVSFSIDKIKTILNYF